MRTRICLFFLSLFIGSLNAQESIIGFTPENTKEQIQLESAFESKLNASNLDSWMQRLAAEPHWVGTKYGEENAKWIQKQFQSWGYDAKIETYQVLFPYPIERVLELTAPTKYTAKL